MSSEELIITPLVYVLDLHTAVEDTFGEPCRCYSQTSARSL